MNIIDFTTKNNILTRWETRTKLIGFLILIFAVSALKELKLLFLTLVIAIVLTLVAAIPLNYLLNKLRIPSLFLAVLGIGLIFFTEGPANYTIGSLEISKTGIELFFAFSIRFFAILIIAITLFASTPFTKILKAMRSFKISEILIDMTMFTYRYFFEITKQMQHMQIAMSLRGFNKSGIKSIGKYVSLIGTIFIRSYDQSQRVYKAMLMRGYGNSAQANITPADKIKKHDIMLLLFFIFIALFLIFAQYFML